MDNKRDRKKIESILREPLTRYRLFLNGKLRAAQDAENPKPFALEELRSFFNGIPNNDPEFRKEVLNVLEAVETGKAPQTPRFDTPEMQLAWGAGLACLKLNPGLMAAWKKPVEPEALRESDLWKQITGTRRAYQELLSHAHHVREALRDKNAKYGWGEPGSGFTFERQKNVINIDLMQSMIVGFEHARADVYREIGHSLLSKTYPKRMQEVFREMQPLLRKARAAQGKNGKKGKKDQQLKPEEYKQLRMLSAEWELRHMMFAAAEENVANRFVSNMGLQMLQDYSVSLNNTAVTFRAVGLTRVGAKDEVSDELRRYMTLCNAVQLSFFQNNGLFDNSDDGWFRVGVNPGLVRKTATLAKRPADQKEDDEGVAHPDFQHLRELCGGPKGLENLQPKQHERLYGWENLVNRVARADLDRKAIIEEIWKLYGEELIQQVLKQANDQIDEQLEEAKKNQQEQGQDQDDQDGDDGQDQDGQDGQDGDDGQEGQEGGKPQKGQKGQKGKKGKKQRGQPQGDPQDMDDADSDDADSDDGQQQDGQQGKKDQKKKDGQKQKGDKGDKGDKSDQQDGEKSDDAGDDADGEGQQQDGQQGKKDKKQKGDKAEGKLGADDDSTVPVEGAGDMPAPDMPTENPSDEQEPGDGNDADGEGQDGQGKDGQDADGNDADGEGQDGLTEEQLEKQVSEMDQGQDGEGQDADGEGEEADGESQGKKQGKPKPSRKPGHGQGKSLGDLAKQDWTDYNKRIAELSGPISRVRKLFKDVQERQLQRKNTVSRTLDILPENGEVKERFNVEAHRSLTIKKATGQVEEQDLKRFHKDSVKMVPVEVDIVIMIDGSGSMGSGSPSPLESALQASAILYEAAAGKDMKMNVFVGMWGDDKVPILIKPGDDRVKIGQAMQAARRGLSSGTDFAPAVEKIAETIGEQRGRSGTLSGFTHVLIISDGDIFDMNEARKNISTMFDYSDKMTFDAAIITASRGTNMQKMAESIKGRKPYQEMGIVISNNPEEVPMAIVGLLLEKVRKCGSFVAVPNSQKRRAMRKAHNKMDPKP